MNAAAKLSAFAVGVALAFGAGWGVGNAVGPIDEPTPAPPHEVHDDTSSQPGSSWTVSGHTHAGGGGSGAGGSGS